MLTEFIIALVQFSLYCQAHSFSQVTWCYPLEMLYNDLCYSIRHMNVTAIGSEREMQVEFCYCVE
jgi:hypothetical protein